MNRAQRPLFSPPPSHNSFLGAQSFTPHLELISCSSHTPPPPQVRTAENKRFGSRKFVQDVAAGRAHELTLAPPGVGGAFFPDGNR
ncbi:hypothetical protein CEXT_111771 [Caerostris extrusa]|uniref:Uncharacterized protein n=1 Tax=Caerostris extrusa TaxID=172846 RepID=A0AAV4PZY1_CAEEX|nr:hypothetical protein CEXT_111771 [Caerostris extrusa]